MIDAVLYSRPVGRLALRPAVNLGYRRYRHSGSTPRWAYRAMRKLFAADPRGFEAVADRSRSETPTLPSLDTSAGIAAGSVDAAVADLTRDGLHVLARPLPDDVIADLEATALAAECSVITEAGPSHERARFDPDHPAGIRLDLDETEVLRCSGAQRLLADESLLAIAQGYLGGGPVQDMVAMWWSAAGSGTPSSAAAQLFHFDLDRLRFLKVFCYLSDVDDEHGPHAFVRGTHRDLPGEFRRDRRYDDATVARCFGRAVTRIGGPRGTVFLADTRALHKGEPLVRGHRLVFQIEYATSLFGQTVTRPTLGGGDDVLRAAARRFPATFARFRPPA